MIKTVWTAWTLHARYEKEKVAKTNETEKVDHSSTNNEVIASAELTEQVVSFNICAVKAAEKDAIGNADDVPAKQAVAGEPELKQTPIKQSKIMKQEATIHVKQSNNETFQNSNTDEELPSVVDV